MAALDVVFPPEISAGAIGGDTFATDDVGLKSGGEVRVAGRSKTIGRWVVSHLTKDKTANQVLRNFFLAVKGMFTSWLYKDWNDYESDTAAPGQSCSPATGNGSNTVFQLMKSYTNNVTLNNGGSQPTAYSRTITKPKTGTLAIYKDGVLQTETTHYTVNYGTGVVTFVAAPANGLTIKATYEFYKTARFDVDENQTSVESEAGSLSMFNWDGISIVEVYE